MVLSHLCWSGGLNIGIAHCNFALRGAESDADEIFVKHWAQERQIPFFSIRFNTKEHAAERGISTQMAARDLRYAWFEEIRHTYNYTAIAAAHHADDNAETLLLNLARGTGLKGLCGMQPVNGYIVRPLLFATRKEIITYATEQAIAYREDSTNATTEYARNRIRHNIIPELQKINPAVVDSMQQTASHLSQAYSVIETAHEKLEKELCTRVGNEWHISIEKLKQTAHSEFWLFEFLQPYNFTGTIIKNISLALDEQAGSRFYSNTHEIIKDRASLIVVPLAATTNTAPLLIDSDCKKITEPLSLQFESCRNDEHFELQKNTNSASIDFDKLTFPLTLRLWKEGDTFTPLGMKGAKKLSDFLIDEKVPLHKKSQQYVLLSANDIVWVVGRRINEHYKVGNTTKKILVITQP